MDAIMQVGADLIDLDRHPIADPESTEFTDYAARCRARLAVDGIMTMPGLTTPAATRALRDEARSLLPKAFYCDIRHNCFLQPQDPSLPDEHPRNRRHRNNKGGVADDLIPKSALLRRVYDWQPLRRFVAAVLSVDALYPLSDPLSSLNINVHQQGQAQGWHFDDADFAVTLMLQNAESGGCFEYVLNLRNKDGPNYKAIERILSGDRMDVRSPVIEDGTLAIFRGHRSLHCVTVPMGKRERINAIFSYATKPGVELHPHTRRLFYGRTE